MVNEQISAVEDLTFSRVNSDVNGNPRYVVHFLNLLTPAEVNDHGNVTGRYAIACKRANTIGGRKFHNKQYGGGIVFCSYSIDDTAKHIGRVTGRTFKAQS